MELHENERLQLQEMDAALREIEGENYGILSDMTTTTLSSEEKKSGAAAQLQQLRHTLDAQGTDVAGAQARTALLCNCVGRLHVRLGQYAEALDCFMQAKDIREKLYGTQHADVAASYHFVAGGYYLLKKYEEALLWLEKDLQVTRELLGEEHPEVEITQNYVQKLKALCQKDG